MVPRISVSSLLLISLARHFDSHNVKALNFDVDNTDSDSDINYKIYERVRQILEEENDKRHDTEHDFSLDDTTITRRLRSSDSSDYAENNRYRHDTGPVYGDATTTNRDDTDTHSTMPSPVDPETGRHITIPAPKNQGSHNGQHRVTPVPTRIDFDAVDPTPSPTSSPEPSSAPPTPTTTESIPTRHGDSTDSKDQYNTMSPVVSPTGAPSGAPIISPSNPPSGVPSDIPTIPPSIAPSKSNSPSKAPIAKTAAINQSQTTNIQQESRVISSGLLFGLLGGGIVAVAGALYAKRTHGMAAATKAGPGYISNDSSGYDDIEDGATYLSESSLLPANAVLSTSDSGVEVAL